MFHKPAFPLTLAGSCLPLADTTVGHTPENPFVETTPWVDHSIAGVSEVFFSSPGSGIMDKLRG